ncbi:MAG: hypothetical protein HRT86_10990 [Ilumatobacteraceae bacterium]|nr:hypothetical protein [Ilumatobacteraceae bacterium]
MGLFNRKKITTVASVAINTVTDTPNTGKDSVLLSVLAGTDISTDLIANYANGLGLKMRGYQIWADNNYTYGLPSGEVSTTRAIDVRVRDIIAAEVGTDVTVISNMNGTVDSDGLAYEHMQTQRGWEFADNIAESPPFAATGVTFYKTSYIKAGNILVIVYTDDTGDHEQELSYTLLTAASIWYHVSYIREGSAIIEYWNYEVSTNVYPVLNSTHNTLQADNPYFPIVPFRVNDVNQADDVNSDFYRTATQLLNRIGMDFAEMAENINANPDIGDVDHAFLYIAVPLMSTEDNTIEYLYHHFRDLEKISVYKKNNYDVWQASSNNTAPPPVNTIHINDSTFNLDFSYTYIDTVVLTQDKYAVGESARTVNVQTPGEITEEYTSGRNDTTNTRVLFSYERSTVTFEHQTAMGVLHVTTIHGLYIENHIYNGHSVETGLEGAVADKSTFLVPVNVNIANKMGIIKNDRLYYDAMWLVFNSYEVTKLEWYQTSLFKAIIMIIAIIITVYSLGSAAESLAAAAAIGASEVAKQLIIQILVSYAVTAIIDFAVETIGIEAAIVLAAAAAIYGVAGGGTFGASNTLLPFADKILLLVQVLVKEIMKDVQEAVSDVQDELNEFLSTQNDMEKEFEKLEKELRGDSADINYLDVIRLRPNIDLTESPSEFYHRAIHSGNIGIASLDVAHSFVETMLELPENKLII